LISSERDIALRVRCAESLRSSRTRRSRAWRERRRRLQIRGCSATSALTATVLTVVCAGAAVGHNVRSRPLEAGTLLAQGSSGPSVSAVQRALGLRVSGVFDRRMGAAVRRFQRQKKLLVDGVVGPQTRAALGLALPPRTGTQGAPSAVAGAPAPLQRIARCESGGNPGAIGGGGRFRGKYQFTRETWASVGGSGDPAAAPEDEQDMRAARLYARAGATPWPVCGR
jgi:hypothetical protein